MVLDFSFLALMKPLRGYDLYKYFLTRQKFIKNMEPLRGSINTSLMVYKKI